MKYPKDVLSYVEVLNKYKENDELEYFDIFHMYPGKLAYPNGYYDSRFFELVGYNTKSMEFKKLGNHDSLDFMEEKTPISMIRIFADKSTLVKLKVAKYLGNTQAASVW